jgi:hypothetical protein
MAWKHAGLLPRTRPEDVPAWLPDLVKPSGSLTSPISHHLHQPSYTSRQRDGETADVTNGCTAMVMGTVFERHKTLMYDQLHRRDDNSEGEQYYPQAVLKCHHDFTHQIMESSESKVEVVYGQKVQNILRRRFQGQSTILPLWGFYEGVLARLVHESAFHNRQYGHRFRKILLFAVHPQRVFLL